MRMSSRLTMPAILGMLCGLTTLIQASETNQPTQHWWRPAADPVYMQEVGSQLRTSVPVQALAVLRASVYAVLDGRLNLLNGEGLAAVAEAPPGIRRLRSLDGALWAATDAGVFRFDGTTWRKTDDRRFVDFALHLGKVHGATRDALLRFEQGNWVDLKPADGYRSEDSTVTMADGSQVLADPVRLRPIERIASSAGTLYMLGPGHLSLLNGKTPETDTFDWGALPSPAGRDMISLGGSLYVATPKGLGELRGMAVYPWRGAEGLPYEDTTCLAQGFDRDLWIGTTRGAARKIGRDFQYFGATHWLPNDRVNDIAVAGHTVYIATDGGLGVLRYEPFTLAKKAAYYERSLEEWGHLRLGFVHKLFWNGDAEGWLREVSDNDGGHTAHFLAAMSFKYAVTGDERDRAAALDAFQAMIWLDAITPKPGFIARAIWSVKGDRGRRGERGSGGLPAKWYPSEDGLWAWKGDTSSDEVNAHVYSVSIFHDLVARGAEKTRAKEHLARMATHILENGWVLRDMDGKPTRWGRWDPAYILTSYGYDARGLNGMEAQTYMAVAYSVTGDERFRKGLDQLLAWGYQNFTLRQKISFPPGNITTWDDELAFRCYFPLLRATQDPTLRGLYLRSLERSWEVKRFENVPFFNFIYGALTGNDCETERSARHLRDWSLDCVNHSYRNSHRDDLAPEPGYPSWVGVHRALSPRETTADWESRSAIRLDGGAGGRSVTPPVGWLEDYWMGRYFGFIEAPQTKDPALVNVTPRPADFRRPGARPYDGPPRPGGLIP